MFDFNLMIFVFFNLGLFFVVGDFWMCCLGVVLVFLIFVFCFILFFVWLMICFVGEVMFSFIFLLFELMVCLLIDNIKGDVLFCNLLLCW